MVKNLKRNCLVIIILLVAFMLCSCDFDESKNNFYGGELLDDEKISTLKEELNTEENGNGETDNGLKNDEVNGNESQDANQTVFWTDNGKVWHASSSCHHLKNSTDIISGTQKQAEEAGKKSACLNCCK